MSKSARIADLNLDASRIVEQPSTTVPGAVNKIISSTLPSQPEKAQIAIEGADHPYRGHRIENSLADEHVDEVKLKKGARVEVTVTAECATGSTQLLLRMRRTKGPVHLSLAASAIPRGPTKQDDLVCLNL
jgi:hypothetical protein